MADSIEKDLTDWLKGAKRVVLVGVGNPIRQDDNVGLRVIQGLQGKLPGSICLLECEMVPEGYLLDI